MARTTVRIGGASGFWGDSGTGPAQLVADGSCNYLILDYLAELTMSILAKARSRDPEAGFATDFVRDVVRPLGRDIAGKRMRIVTNAGGLDPQACARAVAEAAPAGGAHLRVAVVTGDDLMKQAERIRAMKPVEMFSGIALPERLTSLNAYLGAFPIARALATGADIVLTGRVADSALALGILIHEFGWREGDFDLLAAGSLVGHMLECGTQATGGLYTDWRDAGPLERIGYPIAECRADGSFVLTKPAGTGGVVTPLSVAEQMLYEVGDPANYLLPDVICDFTGVTTKAVAPDAVEFAGASGRAPSGHYKVSATYEDGFRASTSLTLVGRHAADKARAVADAVFARCRGLLRQHNIGDFTETSVEIIGDERSSFGLETQGAREVVLRVGVRHEDMRAIEIFGREIAPFGTGGPPGITGFTGRPKPTPVFRLFSFLIPRTGLDVVVREGDSEETYMPSDLIEDRPPQEGRRFEAAPPAAGETAGETVCVPLYALALARSGDKGDIANVAVIARHPDFVAVIAHAATAEKVAFYLSHLVEGEVERFDVPGVDAFNFVLHRALGGGGAVSLRNDPLGKAFGQILLELPIDLPAAMLGHPALGPERFPPA